MLQVVVAVVVVVAHSWATLIRQKMAGLSSGFPIFPSETSYAWIEVNHLVEQFQIQRQFYQTQLSSKTIWTCPLLPVKIWKTWIIKAVYILTKLRGNPAESQTLLSFHLRCWKEQNKSGVQPRPSWENHLKPPRKIIQPYPNGNLHVFFRAIPPELFATEPFRTMK